MRVLSEGAAYMDRSVAFPYEIDENDLCCRLFTQARTLKSQAGGTGYTERFPRGQMLGRAHMETGGEEIRSWPEDKPKKRRQRNR